MIEDFKDQSSPIVDTDYRFGSMVKFEVGLTDSSWLSARYVPWAHESTHLGDEYTIVASSDPGFERVNVSYEYQEYGISYERSFGRNSLLTARHGGIILHGNDGYYSNHLLGSTVATLSPSEKNFEPSLGFEYRFPTPGGASKQFIASVDFRNRLQYSFHHPASGEEHRRPTWTVAIGQTVLPADRRFLRSYFGYFTRGVNPFGQLREQYPWWAAGIGWVFQQSAERRMDYDLDIMLISLVAHRRFAGGAEDSVTAYATDLFNRYNAHIVKAADGAALDLDARSRSVIAAIAAMTPGTTAKDEAMDAIATFVELFDSQSSIEMVNHTKADASRTAFRPYEAD